MGRRLAVIGLVVAALLLLSGAGMSVRSDYARYQQERQSVASAAGISTSQPPAVPDSAQPDQQASALPLDPVQPDSQVMNATPETTTLPLSTPKPAAYRPPSRIVIPAIGLDAPVVPVGIDANGRIGAADFAAGHFSFSKYAGEPGNCIIAGHVDTKGEVFRWIHKLQPGDEVQLFSTAGEHVYRVAGQRIVDPSDTSALADTPDATLTLITCYPYGVDTQRLIVTARLVSGS
ncbi:MAG: class D sortase [Chloroflexi bacterium]|nr:class D sortase [Chloroflexota bacterium]